MSIDKNAIARMMRGIQQEFDKHPIKVPVQADPDFALPPATTVNNYHGPVVTVTGDNAQIAWDADTVNQTQNRIEQIAPGYEQLATLVTDMLANVDVLGLAADDAEELRRNADTVLGEVVKGEPDQGIIKRSLTMIKGLLAPVITGLGQATTEESANAARHVIEGLATALPF